jgi:hypothetical protein
MFRWQNVSFLWLGILLLIPVFTNCNCDESGVTGNLSEIVANPRTLSFDAEEGQQQTREVQITARTGQVLISNIKLVTGAPHYVIEKDSIPSLPLDLAEGKSFTLKITYTAPAGSAVQGVLRIEHDASKPEDGRIDINLLAQINEHHLVFIPEPVIFGEVQREKSRVMEVVGENRGRATLHIKDIKWDPASSKNFIFPDGMPQAPMEIKPGEKFSFKVEYKPGDVRLDQGQMAFVCDGNCAPAHPDTALRKDPYILRFQGMLAAPVIEVTPLQLDYGFVAAGSSKTLAFKISNRGSAPLKIAEISAKPGTSGAFVVPNLTNIEIQPNNSREVGIEFRPSVGSQHQGTVEIKSDDPNRPLVNVALLGKVSSADIEVSPKHLDFGRVPLSKTMSFTIANAGNQPLIVKSIEFAQGSSAEFSIDKANLSLPMTIAPNRFHSVNVTYAPQGTSGSAGKILVSSNDPDKPVVEVTLTAQGTSIPYCDLVARPISINFGLSIIGKTKVIPINWTNEGARDCTISKFEVGTNNSGFPPYAGPEVYSLPSPPPQCQGSKRNYVWTYTCNPPLEIKPGQSLKTDVGFHPMQEKVASPFGGANFDGWLDAHTNAALSRRRIPLTGIATPSCVEVVPDNLDFGLVTVNCSSRKEKLTLYNTCRQVLTVSKIGFSAAGANGFRIDQAQQTPFTVPVGGSSEIYLTFRATPPPQNASAILEIEHSIQQQSPISIPLVAQGTLTSEQTDTFKQALKQQIDILFVIDDSGSMSSHQKNIADNFRSFIQMAIQLTVDFQIGIVTTDVDGSGSPFGGGSKFPPGELRGSPKILDSHTPNLETIFQQNAKVGTSGSATEQGLESARIALSPPLITTGANKGFLRPDASLAIIAVSDEPDQSPQPVQFYINFFTNIKGVRNIDMFRFNAVIGYDPVTKAEQCPAGGQPTAISKGRYLAVAQASRGFVASICTTNWANTLSQLGAISFGLRKQFFLSRPADPTTIQVKVNGQSSPQGANGWTYDATDNSITFAQPPGPGSTIEVQYKAICF